MDKAPTNDEIEKVGPWNFPVEMAIASKKFYRA